RGRGGGDAAVLRAGRPLAVLRSGLRRGLPGLRRLRVPAGRLAVRRGGGGVGCRGRAALVAPGALSGRRCPGRAGYGPMPTAAGTVPTGMGLPTTVLVVVSITVTLLLTLLAT